ncbi:MAG: acyltransferase [Ferruginibacter sp.]|uniref:MBOAT family O-acyltransferase n=1 Tax=Ferruginibacter sp. TaxID=1940288 RepID=UPI00265821A1|nr:MBOAT family O-acyltransferase [Ferruginibacter sp.]MDB5280364.1 acyltransferase [Ferruginibacter sp.]
MLFTSFVFVCLVAATFLLYYLPALSKFQVSILIVSSLVFYAYNQPVMVLLLLLSVGINIVSSYYIVYGDVKHKKRFAIAGVSLNLTILLFFKYSPLFAKTFFKEPGSLGEFLAAMPLPIGISFFTFQGISLVVDVYKEKYVKSELLVPKSFLLHAKQTLLFKGFFPQLISGPIVKAHDFIPQIGRKSIQDVQWNCVVKNMILGYFLKMVVADNLKDFTFWIAFPYFQGYSSLTLLTMLFGYSCQIFADFAGYSLIAISLAKLFGYNFKDNFNFPYIATSFKDFWKRWHISLSSFLMEYLYIPLGGNKRGKLRTGINIMIVMLLGGLWHGAAWSYAVWGGFHGAALVVERFTNEKIKIKANIVTQIFKGLLIFSFVTLAWLLFKLPDFQHVILYFKSIGNNIRSIDDTQLMSYIMLYSSPVLFYHLFYLLKVKSSVINVRKVEFIPYGIMLFLIIVNSGSSGAFIYFQF